MFVFKVFVGFFLFFLTGLFFWGVLRFVLKHWKGSEEISKVLSIVIVGTIFLFLVIMSFTLIELLSSGDIMI